MAITALAFPFRKTLRGGAMSKDLIKRLRFPPFGTEASERNVMMDAADRIEKLEATLREITALGYWDGDSAMRIARKALEGKDD